MNSAITAVETVMIAIDLEKPFGLGFGTLKTLPRVFIRITAQEDGQIHEGFGEASIDFPFSNYDAWDIYWALNRLRLEGESLDDREAILNKVALFDEMISFPAAMAAFNMAIDDLYGHISHQSILDIYGNCRINGTPLTSIPYLPPEQVVEVASTVVKNKGVPKLKVGMGIKEDFLLIQMLEEWSVQNGSRYVLDFNGSYSLTDFILLVEKLFDQVGSLNGLWWAEQPTNPLEGIQNLVLAKNTLENLGDIPVMADESFVNSRDAQNCLKNNIWLNFKIQKVGGIHASRKIELENEELIKHSFSMVGGTFPTAIGRVYDQQAAAILETTSLPSDGWEPASNWFKEEKHFIAENFQFDPESGQYAAFKGDGLGVEVLWEKLLKFEIPDPRAEYRKLRSDQAGQAIRIELRNNASYRSAYETRIKRPYDWNLDGGELCGY